MSATAVALLVGLFVAHFLGDFTPLSTPSMQRAKATGGPMGPIAGHAAVHALLVGLAVVATVRSAVPVVLAAAGLEFITHFGIDVARARLGLRLPVLGDPAASQFWWALGLDQLLHGVVLIVIASLVLGGRLG